MAASGSEHSGTQPLLDLIGLLYDAAADPTRWRDFLDAGSRNFSAFGANFIRYHPDRPEQSLAMLTGMEETATEDLADAISRFVALRHEDPRLLYGFAHPNKPFHCRQAVSTEALHASRSYREVLAPNRVEYTLLVTFDDLRGAFTGLAFMREPGADCFSEADVADLGRLVPHLRRALAIQDRLSQVDHRLQASYAVLENLPTGIAIVDDEGILEYANRTSRGLLDRRDGLSVENGMLCAYRRNGLDPLRGTLREVIASGQHRALSVDRPSGRRAYQAVFSKLWQHLGGSLPNLLVRPRVVCYLSDPDQPLETSTEVLQRLFGLTRGEARLAERLMTGKGIRKAAADLDIQESTARDRLKKVFKKTETSSQAELMRAILSSPAWLAGGAETVFPGVSWSGGGQGGH